MLKGTIYEFSLFPNFKEKVGNPEKVGKVVFSVHEYVFFGGGGQGGLVVKRPPGNQKVGGSNPTTATW